MDARAVVEILSRLGRDEILARLEELEREQHMLRVLLRAARRHRVTPKSDGESTRSQEGRDAGPR